MRPRYFRQFLTVALTLMVVALASQSVNAQCAWPPYGMVAWWPLDEASGPTANDIAPHGFNNAGNWMNSPTSVAGVVGLALSFSGSNSVDVPDHPELNLGTGDFSVDLWIKTTDSSSTRTIIDKRTGTLPYVTGYSIYLWNGKLGLHLADGTGFTNWNSTGFVADGSWHQVAITVDRDSPSGLLFYVDGSAVGTSFNPTGRASTLTNTAPFVIARNLIDVNYRFVGTLDEIELFNRVLDTAEIHRIWAAGDVGKCKAPYGFITGHKYEDIDRDKKISSSVDQTKPGWIIELYQAGGSAPVDITVTDGSGFYSFPVYFSGTYSVREVITSSQKADGWTQILPATVQYTVVVNSSGTYSGYDFLNDSCLVRTPQIYFAGTRDGFAGAEPSSPSLFFSDWLDNSHPVGITPLKQFDVPAHDDYFGHTFVFNPNALVVDATLCMHLKGTSYQAYTDWLSLGDWGGSGLGAVWSVALNDLVAYSTKLTDIEWNNLDEMTVCLDLDELDQIPGGSGPRNILAELQDGELDFFIGDDTEVDWLELTVVYCCDSCDVDSIDVSTGIDPKSGWLGILKKDPEWVIGLAPSPGLTGPATIVNPYPYPQWWMQPSSIWLTAKAATNGIAATAPAGDYIFQYCFCADTTSHPNLDMTVRTDNAASFYLNSTLLNTTNSWSFNEIQPTPVVASPSAFVQGGNVITALVHNDDIVVGLDADGYARANFSSMTTAECCSCFTYGDIDGNGISLTVADVTYLIRFLQGEEAPPIPLYKADVNGDCVVDSLDAVTYANYFTQGLSVFPEYPVRTCCCVTTSLLKYAVPPYKPGDANGDGSVNISDAVYLIAYIFAGGPAPDPLDAGDANCDATVNISDAVYLIAYIFAGGPAPCEGGLDKVDAAADQAILSLTPVSSEDATGSALQLAVTANAELAGIQLEFKGDIGNEDDITVKTTERSRDLQLYTGVVDGVFKVGLIDMSGKNAIAAGEGPIVSFEFKGDKQNLEIERAVVCDRNGQALTVTMEQAGKQTALPTQYGLGQNYPNPFNPSTQIRFALAKTCDAHVEVLNVLGQTVKILASGEQAAGTHSVTWDGTDEGGNPVSSGIYFYRIVTDEFKAAKKMLLLK